ncbi:unnamed protein product (macronuclear) [Paramecium tetraurelia]|uniref:PDZ GRASP-type domain-containing protein n=1 Tax=Paramecium tetraurelia TaxID=5888 RepID=A0BMS8_PARTE|nr:uncharacterized protein GSPATT00030481001 [Paramecium tetraurelia]CAK59845.1 unnamed protein product [Paramecium tetraurelia]|eukprot:XP_001427243.1 hypothetical protein (macronuclear) [Paramecium tetraurelia strain d4-2]
MGNNSTQIGNGYGYRIISIEPNSFGSNLNLEIFLDYIIQIKSDSQVNAIKLLESDEPIELSIFNIFSLETRKIYISEPRSTMNLGLLIRYESINPLILHITKVLKGSPAESSGLKSNQDYLLGVKSHRYQTIDEFSDIVTGQAYSKQSIELCIFSPLTKMSPRVVVLDPKYNWGGPGAIGCEFASGAMHSFNFSQLIKSLDSDESKEVTKNEDFQQQLSNESNQFQQIENQDILINNQENLQAEFKQQIQLENINDPQEHSIDKSQSLSNTQISESKLNCKPDFQYQNEEISNFEQQQIINQVEIQKQQIVQDNSTVAGLDNQQQQQQHNEQIQSDIPQSETHSNLGQQQQDGDIDVKQEFEVKQINNEDSSLQQQNDQLNNSNLEENKSEIIGILKLYVKAQPQADGSQYENDSKQVVVKYANQLVFQSPKRDKKYVVDKTLLFDIQFEVPKYYVNIY